MIDALIDKYSFELYTMYSSNYVSNKIEGKKIALEYLNKYFISENEYFNSWMKIQSKIFDNLLTGLPSLVFKNNFYLTATSGGGLFAESDFLIVQNFIKKIGDNYIIIVENGFVNPNKEPLFRMKYPVDITWGELMNGDFISFVLFDMSINDYMVFSESGNWGKYNTNEFINTLEILGCTENVLPTFQDSFKSLIREAKSADIGLPASYFPALL